ncbi:MAG: DUF1566 domain-containing protein [bacterium]
MMKYYQIYNTFFTIKRIIFGVAAVFTVFFILSQFALALDGPVPDTGQITSYTDTFGEDSDYTINPPSYTKLDENRNEVTGPGPWVMIRDNVTGLIWEVKQDKDDTADYSNPHDADNTYTWYDSNPDTNGGFAGLEGDGTDTEDFINELNAGSGFCGYTDWRLPTIKELKSISDSEFYDPSLNKDFFPFTHSSHYWSSTTKAQHVGRAWQVNFYSGKVGDSHKSESSHHVRAVRGGHNVPFSAFKDNGDGTVTDTLTGLMWYQEEWGENKKWGDALTDCENLSFPDSNPYNDWRLPNDKELQSLVDYSKYDPYDTRAINSSFFPSSQTVYWTSSGAADATDFNIPKLWSWWVTFASGGVASGDINSLCIVRPVRGGQNQVSDHLIILSPRQADFLAPGNVQTIKWNEAGIPGNVKISCSSDGGRTYDEIVATTENDGIYDWTVNATESVNCMLKIDPLEAGHEHKGTTLGLFAVISPDVTVNVASSLATTEEGGSDSFTVKLTTRPKSSVTMSLSSSDPNEAVVSPSSITFVPAGWGAEQTVTVTGVDDDIIDNDQDFLVIIGPAVTSDNNYNGLDPDDIPAINIDNDSAGIIVGLISGETTETGKKASFQIVLNSQPTDEVSINLSSSDMTEGTVLPLMITFNPADWNTEQSVTVKGVDDNEFDGDQNFTVILAPAVSNDNDYNGLDPDDVAVINMDNENISIKGDSGSDDEGGCFVTTLIIYKSP